MTIPFQHTDPPLRLLAAFHQHFPSASPQWLLQSPGREMWVAANVVNEEMYTLIAPDLEGRTVFNWRTAKLKRTITNRPLPRWARYPAGVIVALGDDGIDVPGLEAVMVGEEPPGPRYDYALGLAIAALSHGLNDRPYTADQLIDLVERVRRDYVES